MVLTLNEQRVPITFILLILALLLAGPSVF